MDEQVLIETPRGRLVGMLHRPPGPASAPGVVFCHAFGEERKSSALAMARLARAVAATGRPVLRFDYYGCGDSEGAFIESDAATRLDDVRAAVRFLQHAGGREEFLLLGLRLGGTLAARAAEEAAGCAGLVLVEPVADGRAYFDGLTRRSLVRGMLTRGSGGAPEGGAHREAAGEGDVLDLDGFAMRPAAARSLGALGIRSGEVAFGGPVLVCQVHFRDAARPDMEGVCAAYRTAGAAVTFERLVLPPFWNRVDVAVAPELDRVVCAWLSH
ncbi:MAG: alpha/beta fold hydrolase [Candidatus Brocadiaceae bacterium]|nr:alpha/beta fold hydrolase [Candidatus Brocadiaceae bacterium]